MGKHKEKSKKHKRDKKHKEKKKKRRASTSSSSSADEWVEKEKYSSSSSEEDRKEEQERPSTREEWMSISSSFLTESNLDRRRNREESKRLEREREKYNPRSNPRELNPYWKDGGEGVPTFKKPSDDADYTYKSSNRPKAGSGWKKTTSETPEESPVQQQSEALSSKELNLLASKLVKAEIMGNTELVKELKAKLESARQQKNEEKEDNDEVLLTQTDSKGLSRPVRHHGESSQKKRRVETHKDGQRVRYFADDDKHSLHQMFENEKFNSVDAQNSQFMKLASKVRKNDDMDEIFADNIRQNDDNKSNKRNLDKAIGEHHKMSQSLENCRFCLQSDMMQKHLMVTLGETAFLSLPPYEPLNEGHSLIVPIRHTTCSTLLDENEWSNIMDFRKALTRMFMSKNQDVLFFETAKNLEKYPHMFIECIPIDKEEGDMAPIYFKKAIDECEVEWAQNKKLVSLKGRDVRKAIPKGLPYFFISFGMEEGYAHVIEDAKNFPSNFAQEVIGGMLDLHHSKWRKPKLQSFEEQSRRVVEFSKEWNEFDCTKN